MLKIANNIIWAGIIIEQIVVVFGNGRAVIKFKAKGFEIVATSLCLGNLSKAWFVDNMKKTGLNGYFYDFSAGCNAIAVDDILDIHKYLMKKNNII